MRTPTAEVAPAGAERDPRWRAVLAHDARYDGVFLYAVRSTGVYCKPSCASRRPQRARVEFYAAPADAERAGFRPCRRCRPHEPGREDPAVALVREACRAIDADGAEAAPAAHELGARLGIPPARLVRAFRRVLGLTPRAYAAARRWRSFKAGLRGGGSVTHALYDAGYGSPSRVYERAGERLGMTPAAYGRGGAGMRIGYRAAATPLGRLLVAATGRGVCMVSFGESEAALVEELRREYPAAEIRRGGAWMSAWVRALLDSLRGGGRAGELPLDVRATAFQWRVWQALRAIPPGTTRTYGELARAVGRPRAARAVGRACATNPVSLVIPCHRAVGGGGGLTGYRWGLERKRALLARERAAAARGVKRAARANPDKAL